ncbi:DUF4150 domain-containing protein [Rhizobacter sp. Root16D2]|uniref:DUF4150 domain-containing protein n=1 Tax=Rhizobacter sp. Root16D2 TaxID=1736479 RepID=UPI0006F50AA4|nr:DUF4150 domain-containing protein [Rhizobacter sp. Root16D2]KRB24763.1 hypothetical protein ASE08_00760 [Rhizobacter sp. Root16D2]
MGANVYANGMEVSGKASGHNVIASMPDVCLTPPPPPAGPIPIPYPNFARAADTTDGSRSVMAGGKEISLKGKSKYKKSTGDEAATRNFGGGVISHNITGPVKHKAGSFDVKVEGSQVVRNLDLTTGNHSNPGDGCTTVDTAGVAPGVSKDPDCKELKQANDTRRTELSQGEQKTTITHAAISKSSTTKTVWSCSTALGAAYRNGGVGYVSGLEREDVGFDANDRRISDTKDESDDKGKQASNLCEEAKTQLRKNNGGRVYTTTKSSETPHTSHTEPRILESLFANGPPPAGTTVRLAIQVNKFNDERKKWVTSDDPCPRCHRLICAAALCGITILICDDEDEPQTVEEKTGKDCPE